MQKLPEPDVVAVSDARIKWITVKNRDYYTAEQMQSAIELDRQGRGEPSLYVFFADEGRTIRAWAKDKSQAKRLKEQVIGSEPVEYYTAPQPAVPTIKESLTVAERSTTPPCNRSNLER